MRSNSVRSGKKTTRIPLLAMLASVTLVSCSKEPGGQVVAVVGDEEITQQELRVEAELLQTPTSRDFQSIAPGLLQRVIERNLLAEYARQQGLDRGPEYVARRRQLEQTLLATLAIRKLSGTPKTPTAAEVQKFIADRPTIFARRERLSLDQVRFATPANSADIKKLTDLGTIDAIAARLTADGVRFERGRPTIDTASIDPAIAKQIVALPIGEIFDLTTADGTSISTMTARAPAPAPVATWTAPATEAVKREQANKAVEAAMAKLRKETEIKYDPPFAPPPPAKK